MSYLDVPHTNFPDDSRKWLRVLAWRRAIRNGETFETAHAVVRAVIAYYQAGNSAARALRLFAGPAAPCQGAE